VFADRRERVLRELGPDAVAIAIGGRRVTRSADTQFPFRQDSDFWYLTGFEHPDAIALLRTIGDPEYTLFVQPRDRTAETWNGYRPGIDGALEQYGADAAYSIDELDEHLPGLLEDAKRIFHTLGKDTDFDRRLVAQQESLRQRSKQGFEPASEFVDLRSVLHEMRIIKEEPELELMRRAADISFEAHQEAAKIAQPGRMEYELEAALGRVFRARGGSGPAYSSIVAGGANATILHYIENDQPLREGELVLIDAGVELEGYASDVTRSYPVGGSYQGESKAIYEVVLAAQEACIAASRPGATLPEIHQISLRHLTEGLISLGILSGDVDELIETSAYQPYYMHGTSHWLGLDVHDCGAYTIDKEPRELEPGMVFTIEPGLYIPADDADAPEHFRGIGVRIEDDVAVTEDGVENLTAAIPKEMAAVEEWMRG
jgi:Xaa-Pro aminopeptidase